MFSEVRQALALYSKREVQLVSDFAIFAKWLGLSSSIYMFHN